MADRRSFIKKTGALAALAMVPLTGVQAMGGYTPGA